MWFPRLASDRALRLRGSELLAGTPFVLSQRLQNAERIYCLNACAEALGLLRGMALADARSFCPDLVVEPARPERDARFLEVLRRWHMRYCPWVGREGLDGLVLDVTGSAHLWGGIAQMLADMRAHAARAGLDLRLGIGATRGAAWARAHCAEHPQADLADLPVEGLRLEAETVTGLRRLGLRRLGDLEAAARAPLARRFGPDLLRRLDQAMGRLPEPVTPDAEPPHYGVRLTLPDPIGMLDDVMAAIERLLGPLCAKLKQQEMGARVVLAQFRRVDQESRDVTLRLAVPMREPARILPLFVRDVAQLEAGFGIDQIRLEAVVVEPLGHRQLGHAFGAQKEEQADGGAEGRLGDLMTRIGTRIGLENVQRFLLAESHIPERGFHVVPAAFRRAGGGWSSPHPRPIVMFPPEPVTARAAEPVGIVSAVAPPDPFRWRRMWLHIGRATGPERIAPEWWWADADWSGGVRDYWRVEVREGWRLWLFHTPQDPGWFVQGEFA